MYYRYEDAVLKKLQKEEKIILKDFSELCEKYNIRYFILAGTLLGAVRHKDFIPWDDDIDVGMLREDYNKFLKIPKKEYEKYILCTPERNNDYYNLIPKFYRKDTQFITLASEKANKKTMGIFIEIFVYENVSKSKKKRSKIMKNVTLIEALLFETYMEKVAVFDTGWKAIVKTVLKYLMAIYIKIFHITLKQLNQKYLELIVNHRETGYIAYFCFKNSEEFLCKKADLFPLIQVPFGELMVYIPNNYKEILHNAYGDYMKIPPESERWNHGPVFIKFSDGKKIKLKKEK